MARDDILITLATQPTITDIRRYVLLKVGAWLLSVHISMYGQSLESTLVAAHTSTDFAAGFNKDESSHLHLWFFVCFFYLLILIYREYNINIMREAWYSYYQKYRYFCLPLVGHLKRKSQTQKSIHKQLDNKKRNNLW